MGKRNDAFAARQEKRDASIVSACRHIRTSAELDTYLEADEVLTSSPELRQAVRGHIQALVPHLRDL